MIVLSLSAKDVSEKPMNVIFILTDDQRYDELGFLNSEIQTPNTDRLAREGVYFKNALVTTSLCSPDRASILSGLYAHVHGVVDNLRQELKPGALFFHNIFIEPSVRLKKKGHGFKIQIKKWI